MQRGPRNNSSRVKGLDHEVDTYFVPGAGRKPGMKHAAYLQNGYPRAREQKQDRSIKNKY